MLNLNSLMIGSAQPKVMREFYQKVFGKDPEMEDGDWSGWLVGSCFFSIGAHSEVSEKAQDPNRVIFNFETKEVEVEFNRIKDLGAKVVKEPYHPDEAHTMMIATFEDPDGNYFQLMSPWEEEK
jgi:predicted enzyme related to lactoylglutathione lyase